MHDTSAPNLGYLFYYKYFRNEELQPLDWKKLEQYSKGTEKEKEHVADVFQKKNTTLTGPIYSTVENAMLDFVPKEQQFQLTTIYPGLLIGSGYTHETRMLNEFKLGFYFDHTTGLPHIPGSSVKGALRSPFVSAPSFVLNCWMDAVREEEEKEGQEVTWPRLDTTLLEALELEIFGGRPKSNQQQGKKGGDIFYDAIPIIQPGKSLLGNDFITPHINRKNRALDAFTDPTPLQFMKVLPEITFCFQFELKDGILTAEQKLALFRRIILQLGVGAKTNVGYGQFKP